MFKLFNDTLGHINNSKIIMALLMLTLNIGSKYVDFGFSKTQEYILRNTITQM